MSGLLPTRSAVGAVSGGHDAATTTAAHFVVYVVLGFLLAVALAGWRPAARPLLVGLALAVALGGASNSSKGRSPIATCNSPTSPSTSPAPRSDSPSSALRHGRRDHDRVADDARGDVLRRHVVAALRDEVLEDVDATLPRPGGITINTTLLLILATSPSLVLSRKVNRAAEAAEFTKMRKQI